MLKDKQSKTVLTPFVAAYEKNQSSTQPNVIKNKKQPDQANKEAAREVLNRVVDRVKRI
ncbi:MAG: hypothetical protein ACRDFQ_02785 [Anaerolineales bacterium]